VDDKSFYLALGSLGVSVVAIFIDAAITNFEVPSGFWAVPGGVFAWLSARAAIRNKNGNGNGG
jgi:hypothetical protein